ncbi:MAG: hypothetical protein ACXQS8_06700 [Candidatus Helarchaeales archaeon]
MALEVNYPYLPTEVKMIRKRTANPPYATYILMFKDGFFTGEVFIEEIGDAVTPDAVKKALINLYKQYIKRLEEKDE